MGNAGWWHLDIWESFPLKTSWNNVRNHSVSWVAEVLKPAGVASSVSAQFRDAWGGNQELAILELFSRCWRNQLGRQRREFGSQGDGAEYWIRGRIWCWHSQWRAFMTESAHLGVEVWSISRYRRVLRHQEQLSSLWNVTWSYWSLHIWNNVSKPIRE